MVIREQTYTADEFYALMEARDDDLRFELIEGTIVEMAPPKSINSHIAHKIGMYLGLYVEENDLGYVFGADGGFALTATDVRIPDTSFVAKERIQGKMPDLIPGAPDLAVEVISPSETPVSINDKAQLYFDTGAKVVWIIYPDDKQAEIRTPSEEGYHVIPVGIDDNLHAKSVLPDFELPLNKIFPKPQLTTEA
jgi:Uma2 family endonuclease